MNFVRLTYLIFFLFLGAQRLHAVEPATKETFNPICRLQSKKAKPSPPTSALIKGKDFYMITIPKSGTHLSIKLLAMLTGRTENNLSGLMQRRQPISAQEIESIMYNTKMANQFAFYHTGQWYHRPCPVGSYLARFSLSHPEYVKILQIRDLRDVFVSLVKYIDTGIHTVWADHGLSYNASFDDKLTLCITSVLNTDIENSLAWYNDANVLVIRFEDLVGPEGGGSAEIQTNTVVQVANALNIHLSAEKLQYICDNLFGVDTGYKPGWGTFNNGQIGKWRKYYSEKNKRLFNERWGYHQQVLGYPLAD